jgi:hypothetical protein
MAACYWWQKQSKYFAFMISPNLVSIGPGIWHCYAATFHHEFCTLSNMQVIGRTVQFQDQVIEAKEGGGREIIAFPADMNLSGDFGATTQWTRIAADVSSRNLCKIWVRELLLARLNVTRSLHPKCWLQERALNHSGGIGPMYNAICILDDWSMKTSSR